ncbi:MAG: DNA primase, partial [Oscillospiraceae bacterium]|nr:DNA primase [Oscillospiraceae bacterium]
ISKYGLGYAPDSWSMLTDHLRAEGYRDDELVAANLSRRSTKGGLYDSFRDRAMFPIIDLRGNVIAFGGRVIDGEGPKYLNSSDTPVFRKSRNLFSLNFAKRSNERRLILAEGYMDVITINQAGFENVVATLGTALTAEQARVMSQYADEVIISYDSDGAGQNAAMRAINILSEAGLRTRVLKIDGAKDPDEFIKKFGAARFGHILDNSEGAVNFELQKCADGLDLMTDTGKVEYLKRASQVIAEIVSPIEREVYISRVASDQNISAVAVSTQVEQIRRKKERNVREKKWQSTRTFEQRRKEDPFAAANPGEYRAEKGIIAFLSQHPDELEYVCQRVSASDFVTELNRKIFSLYTEQLRRSSDTDIMSIQSGLAADEMGRVTLITSEAEQLDLTRQTLDEYAAVLKKYADRVSMKPAAQMTDDDLLILQKKLKASKK